MKNALKTIGWLFCLCLMTACPRPQNTPEVIVEEPAPPPPMDTLTIMEHLEESGILRAATNNKMANFLLIDGRPAGFHFELLDDFCEFIDLNLELSVNDSLPDCYQMLQDGLLDVFAGQIDSTDLNDAFHYIIIKTPVESDQLFAWVVNKNESDSSLYHTIDEWLADYHSNDIKKCFYRYFDDKGPRFGANSKIPQQICQYDNLIRAEAKKIGWDWRMLASIIYQESHFKPDLESDKGAYGLMQLMPVTMEKYGIDYDSSVEEQLAAGGKVLLHFGRELPESISDSLERGNFILACYNSGMGHVLESRHIAEKHGKDPDVWTDNVEFYTPKQTYYFVKDITKRYAYYKALIE